MVKPRAIERELQTGKVLELFLTERHQALLKEKKSAWVKSKGKWYILRPNKPQPKDPRMAKIKMLEEEIEKLKRSQLKKMKEPKVNKKSEARKRYWATQSEEVKRARVQKMLLGRNLGIRTVSNLLS